MFDNIKNLLGKGTSTNDADETPFTFDGKDEYCYPSLFEEADEMLQVALLIYTMTDLRTLAKKKNTKLKSPELVLTLPLSLGTCLEMIEENLELIKQEVGDSDHDMTLSALQSIQQRYDRHSESSSTTSGSGIRPWFNPFAQSNGAVEVSSDMAPTLVAYGDEKPESDLVYAVGVDPIRKRVTVAFRGSVTPADFLTDACITLNQQPNPVKDVEEGQCDMIGIHHGFYEYLLKPRKNGENKYTEIMGHVTGLFEDPVRRSGYKLYVTGHSLGGALSTLFSLQAAASAFTLGADSPIPLPVTCVSVASPRVGENCFQSAFRLLERRGALRHLRVMNDRDPVTMMPKSSGKKIWAMLSPVSYIAFKLSDRSFEEKETYRHTGIKLKLRKAGSEVPYEIAYSGAAKAKEEKTDEVKPSKRSYKAKSLPDVVYHFGKMYSDNLISVKEPLAGMTLNELYKDKAALSGEEVALERTSAGCCT